MSTTRFLFPEESGRPGIVPTVLERKSAEVPQIARNKLNSTSLPPVKQACNGRRLSDWTLPSAPTTPRDLAHYKHYDVQLDWCEVRYAARGKRE
jgi:hypothetical protein